MDKIKHYPKEDINVIWNSNKCQHCALCVAGLPAVFKPKEKPWIQLENATKEEVIAQVEKCPSGALSWE